jgi:hypothetical protein
MYEKSNDKSACVDDKCDKMVKYSYSGILLNLTELMKIQQGVNFTS